MHERCLHNADAMLTLAAVLRIRHSSIAPHLPLSLSLSLLCLLSAADMSIFGDADREYKAEADTYRFIQNYATLHSVQRFPQLSECKRMQRLADVVLLRSITDDESVLPGVVRLSRSADVTVQDAHRRDTAVRMHILEKEVSGPRCDLLALLQANRAVK